VRVTVLYFAAARERAGTDRDSFDLPAGASAGNARARAIEAHPALAAIAPHLRLAVDKSFANDSAPLRDGSEIALIPPVSGGAP
jgi:molybdopterin synthase catalytic subunit